MFKKIKLYIVFSFFTTAAKKVPSPPLSDANGSILAQSLPANVPTTPGRRDAGPRTPRSKGDDLTPRFYPVMKDSSHPPDPQVITGNNSRTLGIGIC